MTRDLLEGTSLPEAFIICASYKDTVTAFKCLCERTW